MRTYLAIVFFFVASFTLFSQENTGSANDVVRKYVDAGQIKVRGEGRLRKNLVEEPFKKVGLAFSVSSMGFGVEAVTPINERFKVRAGLDYAPPIVSIGKQLAVKDNTLQAKVGYYPDYKVDFKPSFFNGHVLVDYYPSETAIFHFTAGFYLGTSDIKAEGDLINPENGNKSVLLNPDDTWPLLNVEGYALNIDNGTLDADIRMGSAIKPYVGIGFGNLIPSDRFGFNLDLGILYQGDYTIRQNGKSTLDYTYTSSAINIDKYTKYVKVWPMLKFQLTYRIF